MANSENEPDINIGLTVAPQSGRVVLTLVNDDAAPGERVQSMSVGDPAIDGEDLERAFRRAIMEAAEEMASNPAGKN